MPITWGPLGTTDGIVLCLDAANPKSTKANDGWYNVGGEGRWEKVNVFDTNNPPTLGTKDGAACYIFNSIGQRFQSSPAGFVNPASTLTIETWVYPEANITSGDRMNIIRGNSGGTRAYMSYNKSNSRLSNYWYSSSVPGYHETVEFSPGRNVWQHLCAVWNGTTLKQYVNYENQGSVSTNSSASTFGTEIQIGWEGNDRQFSGGIAMIRMYNKALSDEEVFRNFNSTKGRFGF